MLRRLVVASAAIATVAIASILVPDPAQAGRGGSSGHGGGGGGGTSHAVAHSSGGGGALHPGRSNLHSQYHHVTHGSSLNKSLHKSSLNKSLHKSSLHKSNKSLNKSALNKSNKSLNKSALNKSDKSLNKSALNKSLMHNAWGTHHNHFFGRRVFVVWFGPIFWPYAFYDLFDYVFWVCDDYYYYSYGCYDRYGPFWAYGYDDLFGGVYWPYLYAGDYGGYGYRRSRVARNDPAGLEPRGARPDELAQLCGGEAASLVHFPFDRIAQRVQPTDAQRTKFEELKSAAAKAADKLKASCPSEPAFGPLGRLDTAEQRFDAMLDAMTNVRAPLLAFYDSLDDQQKARLDAMGLGSNARGGREAGVMPRVCSERGNAVAQLSIAEIERNVQPTDAQRADLEDLRNASTRAADSIKASCPKETPLTVTTRIQAVEGRLAAMLDAVKTVRGPLEKFYDSLSDEQRQRFNRMGQPDRRTG